MRVIWFRPTKGDHISVRRERVAEELRSRGYEVDICDASGFDALSAVKQAVKGDYDIIAGNVRMGLFIAYPLSRILRKPLLGDVSDPISDIDYLPKPLFKFFEWYEWQVLKRAEASVYVYESMYRKANERGITDGVKLPNAVNYEQFAEPDTESVEESKEVLVNEGVELDKPIAIYIGTFSQGYCIEEILETAEYLPEWEFVLLGQSGREDIVRQTARELENVYFPGAFPYRLMPGFLSHADFGFCFKDAEQPLKLKEYGAAGLPIVVRPGELSKWHDENELVFVEPNPEVIAQRLEETYADEQLYESYCESGRAIASEWSWEKVAAGYDELFQQMLAER